MPVTKGMSVTAASSRVYSSTCSRVKGTPWVTSSMGMPTFAYSSLRAMASAQKCGGVHTNTMRNSSNAFASMLLVTAAQPSTGGAADHDVLRRRALEPHGVDDGVADQRGERERGGEHVHEQHQHGHRQRG